MGRTEADVDPSRFHNSEAGRLVKAPEGFSAFVPASLPPRLEYGQDLVLALSRADAALSELSIAGEQLPNPHLLIAPYLRQEAVPSMRDERPASWRRYGAMSRWGVGSCSPAMESSLR